MQNKAHNKNFALQQLISVTACVLPTQHPISHPIGNLKQVWSSRDLNVDKLYSGGRVTTLKVSPVFESKVQRRQCPRAPTWR